MQKRPLPPHAKLYSENAKKVFQGVRFDVYQWQQEQFDGSVATFEIVKRNDTVIVMPILDGEVILVSEQQPHWDKPGLCLVAGMVNPGEELKAAARRELEEETGLIFDTYQLVHVESGAPSVEWFEYTFVAYGYRGQKEKHLDPGEKNEVLKISLDELVQKTCSKELLYPPHFIEDLVLQGKLPELYELVKNPATYESV